MHLVLIQARSDTFVIVAACVHVKLYAMIITYFLVTIFWLAAEDASYVSVTDRVG